MTDREIGATSVNVVNLYNYADPFNHLDEGAVAGARNYGYLTLPQEKYGYDPLSVHYSVLYDTSLAQIIFAQYLAVDKPFGPR